MTLLGDPPALVVARPGLLRRVWALPLRAHLAALALALVALVPLVGTSASFSTDEGAAIIEAKSLASGRGWIVEHPFPAVDPDGRNYPLELSERGPEGFVAFGKHPLYVVVLAAADRVGGVTAMVLLSLGATVCAAGLSAALARRMDASLARPALWVVGLASPLLFDGFLVMAHTLAAALAAAAVLAAVVALERRSRAYAAGVGPLVAGAVLMRSEAVFLAVALAAVAAVVALRRPLERATAVAIGAGALLAGGGANVFERWWTSRLLGGRSVSVSGIPALGDPGGFVAGRVHGFVQTVLAPTNSGKPVVTVLLLAMVAAVAVAAVTARFHPDRRGPIVTSTAVAAALAVSALFAGTPTPVPGLLVAFPLGTAGLLLVRRSTVRTTAALVSFAVVAIFALCVIATQYSVGGATEWGGRFFALGVPLLVPVVLLALKDQATTLDRHVGRSALVALAVCSLALGTLGIASLRHQHRRLGQLVATADRAGQMVATGSPGERPVMIATYGSVPRWAWATFAHQRWLLASPADLAGLLVRLRGAGVSRVGLVTPDIARDRALLGSSLVLADEQPSRGPGWHVLVLQIS